MNINLLRNLAQHSKKCPKMVYNITIHDTLCTSNNVRHNSTLSAIFKTCLSSQKTEFVKLPKRCYCQENGPPAPSQKLPPLMNFPLVVWPSLFQSLKNLIFTTFIIKPYFDVEFSLQDFVQGSKKAVEVISHQLSKGQHLEGLVTPDIIPTLQDTVSNMSLSQREMIPINVNDIYFSFPYQVGIMFSNDDSKAQKRFVEITMVYHVLRGLSTMRSHGHEPPLNAGMLPEYQDKISICNYRFIREYTKDKESGWIVNLLNHFRPIDDAEE
ncbi:m-AAA protease-interacting protein 1, mitochondrial [Euwallacea fornicatus]|uniref:m-AAA protease-interacting protein 1, mitochondrial n=1 Tax=Euwallacea fornicatus TaxID=995702 RepID=UPI00339044C9